MLKKSHLEKVMSNFFKQYFYQPTIVESGLFDFMLSRVIAMFLQLEIVIDGSINEWVSPESIHFWPMEMRGVWGEAEGHLLGLLKREFKHWVIVLSTQRFLFLDTMNFQIYI